MTVDGRHVYFIRSNGDLSDYFRVEVESGDARWVSDYLPHLALSPDESRIAYFDTGGIYIADADTGRLIEFFPVAPVIYELVYSPDGRYIAFTALTYWLRQQIYIVDLESGQIRRLNNNRNLDFEFSDWFVP